MTHPAQRGAWEWLTLLVVCVVLVIASLYGCGGPFVAGEVAEQADAGHEASAVVVRAVVEDAAAEAYAPACPPDDGGNPWAEAGRIPCPSGYACAVPRVGYECLNSAPATMCLADGGLPQCATQEQCGLMLGQEAQCTGGYCRLGCQ